MMKFLSLKALVVIVLTLTAKSRRTDATDVDESVLETAVRQGLTDVHQLLQFERQLLDNEPELTISRPGARPAAQQRLKTVLDAVKIVSASSKLQQQLQWSAGEVRQSIRNVSLAETSLKDDICSESISCPETKTIYRSIDGSCNNLNQPSWGKSNTPYQRALNNAYHDGIWLPRNESKLVGGGGAGLSSPRLISTRFTKSSGTITGYTLMLMSWGQLITHDITRAPTFTSVNGETPQCCNTTTGGDLNVDQLHPFCLPISIPASDPFYSQHNQRCMSFVRTQIGADYSCTMGHAEQLNSISHWLDGSIVYGSDEDQLATLRSGMNGLLKTSLSDEGKELLPLWPSCSDPTCYYAGDVRAQENPQLAVLHTIWMRQHNRMARALAVVNPHWDDERLFQETRRIVISQLQHITYNEYLPAMLGQQAMNDYKLTTAPIGQFAPYDATTASNPSIWNEFAAAVYRVGHSQVQGFLQLFNEQDQMDNDKSFTLSDWFFDSSQLPRPGFIDSALRGLTRQLPDRINSAYTTQLTNLLLKGKNPFGMDLVAINIQRGREHGIPDYNSVRVFCGLPKANSFDDLVSDMEPNTIEDLRIVYASVDDIDLYVGCLAESARPANGSLMGPTTLCIIGRQFGVTKNNDRFFYDVGQQDGSFTLGQLDEIRKGSSLARVLCDNNNGQVTTMQPYAFLSYDTSNNARLPCTSIPSIDLALWQDEMTPPPPSTTPASSGGDASLLSSTSGVWWWHQRQQFLALIVFAVISSSILDHLFLIGSSSSSSFLLPY